MQTEIDPGYGQHFYFDDSKTDDIMYVIRELEDKYFDLVWLARKPNPNDPDGMAEFFDDGCTLSTRMHMAELKAKYPSEVHRLSCPESGDWEHGFNSGILAAMRFLTTAMTKEVCDGSDCCCDSEGCTFGGIQDAVDEFPFLDT